MVTIEPLPDRTLIVLRNEAQAARDGTMVVCGIDIDMAELLDDAADEIEQLRAKVEKARSKAYKSGWDDALRSVGKLPPVSDKTQCDDKK